MFRIRRFLESRHRTGWVPQSTPTPEAAQPEPAEVERITRLVSERLAEDERLRGDLTDRGFGPVLDLVTSLVPSAAAKATTNSQATNAEDAVSHGARTLVRAIVEAAQSGEVEKLDSALTEPIVSQAAAERVRSALANEQHWPESTDERAGRLVEIVRAAIEVER